MDMFVRTLCVLLVAASNICKLVGLCAAPRIAACSPVVVA
jgi:hypothetical protein